MKTLATILALVLLLCRPLQAAITFDDSVSVEYEGTQLSLTHTVSSTQSYILASIAFEADNDQEVSSVEYAGESLTFINTAQLESKTHQEVWSLYDPVTTTGATLVVDLTATAKTVVSVSVFQGVSHTGSIYFRSAGVGKNVDEIPMVVEALAGNSLVGIGLAHGDAKAITITGQTLLWNTHHESSPEFRSEAIMSPLTFTASFTVRNSLDKAADWSICIIGLQAAD